MSNGGGPPSSDGIDSFLKAIAADQSPASERVWDSGHLIHGGGDGRFRVVRRLGEGGMGVVYEAIDRTSGERVALKTIRRSSAEAMRRFKREFRLAQDLHHPNLVQLGELFAEGQQLFFTMELIDGQDFLEWVRPMDGSGHATVLSPSRASTETDPAHVSRRATTLVHHGQLDERRLRDAFLQLSEGLVALHAANRVHRDLKPSNVRVDADGRVVILDFGLVVERDSALQSTDHHVVGTPEYMSPEQAAAKPAGPASDWYAAGVMLFEALTGRVPFHGVALTVLLEKQRTEPPSPQSIVPNLPDDLCDLCERLLRFEPTARPSGRDVIGMLGGQRPRVREATSSAPSQPAPPILGRDAEMTFLSKAASDARSAPVTVLVDGESGVGKSSLVRRFCEHVTSSDPRAVVLAGRCYERDSTPYKAFDGVIDSLTRWMARLPRDEAALLMPRRATALSRIFPTLRRVPALAMLPISPHEATLEPQELRRIAFLALRELLGAAADRGPLFLVIDDLQWGDADSLSLLAEVLRPPEAPAVLLLATTRVTVDAAAVPEPVKLASELPGDVRRLHVDRLAHDVARELTQVLLDAAGAPVTQRTVEAIATDAGGHPLFIAELVRHAATARQGEASPAPLLDDVLWQRVQQLDDGARAVVQLAAVAGTPLPHEVLAEASGLSRAEFARQLSALRVANLVRTSGGRGSDHIEPYHDRVRETVLGRMGASDRSAAHRTLAIALEAAPATDPQQLASHWLASGDSARASKYAADAARKAADALAFDRAADLFELALRTCDPDDQTRGSLLADQADALANVGRSALAARSYAAAAGLSNAADALELRRRSAEQLLRSGHIDEGLAAIAAVLQSVGLRLPKARPWALVQLVFWRFLLRVRGEGVTLRDASLRAPRALIRIDTCWSVGAGLACVDTIMGACFHARALYESLREGDQFRVARSLAAEAAYLATYGPTTAKRFDALQKRATELAGDPPPAYLRAWLTVNPGFSRFFRGYFADGLKAFDRSAEIVRECPGSAWELAQVQFLALEALGYMGEISEVSHRIDEYLKEAAQRGDMYSRVLFRVTSGAKFSLLALDKPDQLRRAVRESLHEWSRAGFHLVHLHCAHARCDADLYTGHRKRAWTRIEATWPAMRRSLLLFVPAIRIPALDARARCALAMAQGARKRGPLLRKVSRWARAIASHGICWAAGLAGVLKAGVASLRGDRRRAVAELRAAIGSLEESGMALHVAVARRRLGALLGGEEGAALVSASREWMASRGIVHPDKLADVYAPGAYEDAVDRG